MEQLEFQWQVGKISVILIAVGLPPDGIALILA
jgi:hypothetical protein